MRARYEGSNLVWITGAVMAGVTLYEGGSTTVKQTGSAKKQVKTFNSTYTRLIAIALLLILLSITVDQAPEFGKPLTLLILIAFLTIKTPVIKDFFNHTQGTTK